MRMSGQVSCPDMFICQHFLLCGLMINNYKTQQWHHQRSNVLSLSVILFFKLIDECYPRLVLLFCPSIPITHLQHCCCFQWLYQIIQGQRAAVMFLVNSLFPGMWYVYYVCRVWPVATTSISCWPFKHSIVA